MREDLIKRSDAIKALCDAVDNKGNYEGEWLYTDELCRAIGSVPSADRPQGKWERVSADKYVQHAYHYYRCSKCGYDHLGKTNFCPNCGAVMRGDNDGKDIQSTDE